MEWKFRRSPIDPMRPEIRITANKYDLALDESLSRVRHVVGNILGACARVWLVRRDPSLCQQRADDALVRSPRARSGCARDWSGCGQFILLLCGRSRGKNCI